MTNQQANDLFATLKTYINKVSEGEKSPQEIAASLNTWARESAESLKAKIAEEVEGQVQKLGFIKRDEFDRLAARVATLDGVKAAKSNIAKSNVAKPKTSVKKKVSKSSTPKKTTSKKTTAKKSAAKKVGTRRAK